MSYKWTVSRGSWTGHPDQWTHVLQHVLSNLQKEKRIFVLTEHLAALDQACLG